MKNIFFGLILLFKISASACPDLAGDWTCKDETNKTSLLKITQEVRLGHTLYRIHDLEYETPADLLADGMPHDYVSPDGSTDRSTATCTQTGFTIQSEGQGPSGQYSYKTKTVMTKTDPNEFKTTWSGILERPGQAKKVTGSKSTCKK